MSNPWTIKWIRRFFRRRMKPVPVDKAHLWKQRLSVVYMILSWNAFGIVLYMMFTGKSDWAKSYGYKEETNLTPAQQWARTLNVENAKVIRISGLRGQGIHDIEDKNDSSD